MKFDWQIVAIAKVNGASIIYSDDAGVRSFPLSGHVLPSLVSPNFRSRRKKAQIEMKFDQLEEARSSKTAKQHNF